VFYAVASCRSVRALCQLLIGMEGHSSVRTCTYSGAYWNGRAQQCAHLHIFGCLLEWKGTAVCAPAHIRVLIGMEGHSSVRTCTYSGAYRNGRAQQCAHLHIFGCLLEWKGTAVYAPAHIRVLIGMEGHSSVRTCTYSGAYWNGRALQCAHLHVFSSLARTFGYTIHESM